MSRPLPALALLALAPACEPPVKAQRYAVVYAESNPGLVLVCCVYGVYHVRRSAHRLELHDLAREAPRSASIA